MSVNRRSFIRNMSLCIAGLTYGSFGKTYEAVATPANLQESSVSLTAGNDRRDILYHALKPFKNEVQRGIEGKQVIIKPNLVYQDNPLCVTDPDAVRAVLDFLKPMYDRPVIIAESSIARIGTLGVYEQYGYNALEKEYGAKLVDLNQDTYTPVWITDSKRHPLAVNIIDTYLNPDNYIISVARMKTHDCVFATLAMKNMIMGSPITLRDDNLNEKPKMHEGGVTGINHNIFLVAQKVRPEFSVVDGFVGMEGNGPIGGTPVEHRIALAGPDVVSVDRIGLELMGIPYEDIGYLQWCSNAGIGQGDRTKIRVIGPDPAAHSIKYRLHEKADKQHGWKDGILEDPRR
ncbi:MAG: DUF362 domain-containing protein [Candidatus Latescibacteria bacterium]|nr:DUF362 domain-containing protein [Candidatus Latescibacterota bacterium]